MLDHIECASGTGFRPELAKIVDISFSGCSVIVTGAARGIGDGITRAFAARGATVFAADLLGETLHGLHTDDAPNGGGSVETRSLDVTDFEAVQALVAEAQTRSSNNAVDVLVHSAGGVCGQRKQPIESVSIEDWHSIQHANVLGAFLCAKAVVPGMKRAGNGRIVIISSRAGLGVSLTGIAGYGTAKAAQIGLVRQLANELGPFGITVNSVAPGFMRTSPDYERQWQSYSAAQRDAVLARIAMRRDGTPQDIANAVMFFASKHASWITGQTLAVTGSP